MTFPVRMGMEPLRTLAFGSISGTYANVGDPLLHPARAILFQNYTNAQLTFSIYGGAIDNFVLASNTQFILDIASNEFQQSGLLGPENMQISVKGTPASGNVYVSVIYAGSTYSGGPDVGGL